ncbi:hypothetical protein HYW73_01975 [Candidatus Nomurabacteria bacterium]|nr:hypothetical protein [Candidatus Nomurabacteria bacterium]
MSKFICGGNEYEIVNDTIFRPVSFKNLPEEIKVQGEILHLISPTSNVPFHVSLVYIKKIIDRYN